MRAVVIFVVLVFSANSIASCYRGNLIDIEIESIVKVVGKRKIAQFFVPTIYGDAKYVSGRVLPVISLINKSTGLVLNLEMTHLKDTPICRPELIKVAPEGFKRERDHKPLLTMCSLSVASIKLDREFSIDLYSFSLSYWLQPNSSYRDCLVYGKKV